jgi:uncharacterized protein
MTESVMLTVEEIRREVLGELEGSPSPHKVILFGSYAYGEPGDDSDLDLVVILDKRGSSPDYNMFLRNKLEIARKLRRLRRKYPVDLLVYTRDEWDHLRRSGSSFIRKIEREGIALL